MYSQFMMHGQKNIKIRHITFQYQIIRLLVNKKLQSEVTSFMLISWILSGWDTENYEILSSKSRFSDRD